jgi:hypothetical protein
MRLTLPLAVVLALLSNLVPQLHRVPVHRRLPAPPRK